MTNTPAIPIEQTDVLEQRIIDHEYKIWKKNTPYLYDFVMTHSQEWPSLTCQWLPTIKHVSDEVTEHSLLVGTHTTGEQNFLMVTSCALPRESSTRVLAETSAEGANPPRTNLHYDDEKNEVGGFGQAASAVGKLEIKMKIKHEGEVNRARYMPGNHFIVASRGPNPEVYIFDLSKHPSFPERHSVFAPQAVCIGHTEEGYAMQWNPHRNGMLLTGSNDTKVMLWDVQTIAANSSKTQPGTQIKAVTTFQGHSSTVEDVDWHSKDPHMFGSVGDDRIIQIWDDRQPNTTTTNPTHTFREAHDGDINSIAFSPFEEFLFATGSGDKTVKLWDLRNTSKSLGTLCSHSDQVYKVEWAPFDKSILASCSDDRRIAVWDLSRIGMEQSPEDAEDGPPELLFLHGGHTSKVSDFSWNPHEPWTIASVSEDNVLQVWNMAEEIYKKEEDEEGEQEGDEDGLLRDEELDG